MWGFVLSIAERAAGFFFGSASSITNTDARDAVVGVFAGLQALGNFLQKLLGDEMVAWRKAGPQVRDAGDGLGNLAFNEMFAWRRLVYLILPGSLRWLWGHVYGWANPKFLRIWRFLGVLDRRTRFLGRFRNWAVPRIWEWIHFRHFYFTWPNATVKLVHNWLRQPWRFQRWATPILAPALVKWFTQPHHQTQRDGLARAIVETVPEVHTALDAALVNLWDRPYP